MTLDELALLLGPALPEYPGPLPSDARSAAIDAVTEDSRKVRPGTLFVAAAGVKADGHSYAEAAAAAGAVAILGDRPGLSALHRVPYLYTPAPRTALGLIAHRLAGDPTRAMKVVGITGTNGKSSTVRLLREIICRSGHTALHIGTLGYGIGDETIPAPLTTPPGEELAALFATGRERGAGFAIMEVSSHALDQDRVAGIEFTGAAFTNLTQDHLDYHADLDAYRRAKLRLFERIGPGGFTVVNADDPSAPAFLAASSAPCHLYGVDGSRRNAACPAPTVRLVERMHPSSSGGSPPGLLIAYPGGKCVVRLKLIGRHNELNALCAFAAALALGLEPATIAEGIENVAAVPGRFEQIEAGQPFHVVVDYAHTEDGLRNVLRAARDICPGRLICVFGCGGDRDRGKRPRMGCAAAELADFCVVTSDNPRTEDPHRIIEDILSGMDGLRAGSDYWVLPDRAEAIREAIQCAQAGDLVLIAGKGHEDYQILGTERIHFDDREQARAALEAL